MQTGQRAHTMQLDAGVFAVDTEYVRPMLDASHLIIDDGRAAFVDTGTNDSVPLLIDALNQQGLDVGDVNFVFLTHIHLDHAGGAGLLMQQLPNAKCVIHPRGAAHMIRPAKLIAGTEQVYGVEMTRKMYGVIQPIEEARVIVADDEQWFDFGSRRMQAFFTEGHALHHYCLHDPASNGVFTGDSFGVSYRELDTAAGEFIFPAATPTHFDPVAAHVSVDRIMSYEPANLYLTHYSRVTDLQRLTVDMHAGIDAYAELAMACIDDDDPYPRVEAAMREHITRLLHAHGFQGDDETMGVLLDGDIGLNAQGLVSWLQRLKKQRQ
jgi:glyoxylase-like metal-dependent hydrolase (beta-lactamase superfamily II)